MEFSKWLSPSIFLSLFFLSTNVVADKVVLDKHSDQAGKWLEITCLYNEDYNDFWVFGYPVTLVGDDDVYPNQQGFWTPGTGQRCEMHYFGGADMPVAKTLTVGMYVKGKPQILISAKHGPADEDYFVEIGSISEKDGLGWFEKTIDLTDKRPYLLNFTLISMDDDLLLLDKIELDLGEDTTTPAPIPEPTTTRPIKDDVLTLDTDADYWIVWEEDCHYVEDSSHFWAYGCPVEPKQDDDDEPIGYWNPCSTTKSCTLSFYGNASVLWDIPEFIKIRSYVDGQAKINITAQSNRDPTCDEGCSMVGVIDGTEEKWTEVSLPLNATLSGTGYKINIELAPSPGSTVLVEKVSLLPPKVTNDKEDESSASGTAISKCFITTSVLVIITSRLYLM